MDRLTNGLLATSFVLGALVAPAPAHAFDALRTCWPGDEQLWETSTFHAEITDISFGPSTQVVVEDAIEEWDNGVIGDSSLNLTASVSTFTTINGSNSINEVAGVSSLPAGVLGFADIRGDGCLDFNELVECDIHINFSSFTWPATSSWYDMVDEAWLDDEKALHDTIRHEAGHCIGMGHTAMLWDSAEHLATMNPVGGSSSIIGDRQYLVDRSYAVSEDDRVGVRTFYPATLTRHDVAVQSYKYRESAADAGECTKFDRPRPSFNDLTAAAIAEGLPAGSCPEVTESLPPPALLVVPGEEITVGFTLLNLGTETEIDVSGRILITTEDDPTPTTFTVVHNFSTTLAPNLPFETPFDIVIPDVPLGLYHVILQLDDDGMVSEFNENNNEAFYNRKIVVDAPPAGCNCSTAASGASGLSGAWLVLLLAAFRRRDAA